MKVRSLDAIKIDLQLVRLLIKEWVSERSLSHDSKTPIVAKIHQLGRGSVGGTAPSPPSPLANDSAFIHVC